MEAKEEIRSRLNIEDVIGEYVQLKRAGRNFKGLSPFTQEKTASFMVSPEKHIWHDFSTGKGGDVFTFVMELEGVDFKGAMELLARKAGVDLGQFRMGDGRLARKKERLLAALDMAAKYYQLSLINNKSALEYVVKKRGLNKTVVQDFRIGYAPDSQNALLTALRRRDFTEPELREAGLVVTRRFGPGDMFRARMMVPLMDPQGRVIGFTARILVDDPNAPKYINTPQTLLYDKGRHVFGLHLAKEAIRKAGFVVLVEGNMDVISTHQAGFTNVVATAGTALTEYHLKALSRFTSDVRLAFDADKAGISATERAIVVASNMGITLRIITLPDGAKDPDDLIKDNPKKWQTATENPKDAVEWLLDIYATRFDITSAEGKRRATDQALGIVAGIDDPVLSEHYLMLISQRIGSSVAALTAKLTKAPQKPEKPLKQATPKNTDPNQFAHQDHLLALAWAYAELRDTVRKLEPAYFEGNVRQAIATEIVAGDKGLQSDDFRVKIQELELIVEAKYPRLSDELYFTASGIAKKIKKEQKIRERQALKNAFASAVEPDERQRLSDAIKKFDKEIEALNH